MLLPKMIIQVISLPIAIKYPNLEAKIFLSLVKCGKSTKFSAKLVAKEDKR